MSNKNINLKTLLIALIALSNSLFSTNQTPSNKRPKIKPVITRDIAINIGKFLPGDDKFLNELVRLYPAEEETYRNIAKKLIEKKLIINNYRNIDSILDKHFKTSRIKDLKSKLEDNVNQIDNYPLLIEKQYNYLHSLLKEKKLVKYLSKKEEILNIYKNIYREIKYIINNESSIKKEQLKYYRESIDKLIELTQELHQKEFESFLLLHPANISVDTNILIGLVTTCSGELTTRALSSIIDIPQQSIFNFSSTPLAILLNLYSSRNNPQDILKLGLSACTIAASMYAMAHANVFSIKLARKLINNKKQRLKLEMEKLINKVTILKNKINLINID